MTDLFYVLSQNDSEYGDFLALMRDQYNFECDMVEQSHQIDQDLVQHMEEDFA